MVGVDIVLAQLGKAAGGIRSVEHLDSVDGALLQAGHRLRGGHRRGRSAQRIPELQMQGVLHHANLQALQVCRGGYLFIGVQLTEAVLCNTHAVESVLTEDFFQLCTCFAIEFCICIVVRIIDEWKRNNVETWIKCRVDQVGVHGDLNRVPIHQSLNTFGLVSVGQLVCGIYVDFDLAAGCFFHELAELASAFCPGTVLGGGAGKVPGLLFPSKITVILYGICTDAAVRFLGKDCDQVCCILVALIL